jgi:hypothetical protein
MAQLEGARVDRDRRESRANSSDQKQSKSGSLGSDPPEERRSVGRIPNVSFDARNIDASSRKVKHNTLFMENKIW